MVLRLSVAGCLLALLAVPAMAADLSDADYTSKFFGTIVTFKLAAPLKQEQGAYWTDNLPSAIQDPTELANRINPARQAAGRKDLISEQDMLFQIVDLGADDPTTCSLGYAELSPSEVKTLLASVDNLKTVLPGATLSFSPLKERMFDVSADGLTDPVAFSKAGVSSSLPVGVNAKQMRDSLTQAFQQRFGAEATIVYLSYTEGVNEDGSSGRFVSFDVRIGPAAAAPAAVPAAAALPRG